MKVTVFNYSRKTKYIHKATRNTQRNDAPIITHSRSTVASYDKSVKSKAAHIWNKQLSTTRDIKSVEAYIKTKRPFTGNNREYSY